MIARFEQKDGTYKFKENGEPECGEDFCDACGDCLDCYPGQCMGDRSDDGLSTEHCWVVYLSDEERTEEQRT